jgi:hypothetical protein
MISTTEPAAQKTLHVPQSILGIGRRPVFVAVTLEEFIGGLLNGFPLLLAGFLFENLL